MRYRRFHAYTKPSHLGMSVDVYLFVEGKWVVIDGESPCPTLTEVSGELPILTIADEDELRSSLADALFSLAHVISRNGMV